MSENGGANKDAGRETSGESPALFWGKAACGLGIILAVVGIVAAFFGTGASVVPGAVGYVWVSWDISSASTGSAP